MTEYEVTAWWTVQRGCKRMVEADTPEQALAEANRLIREDTWDLSFNDGFDDSEGPTNLEIMDGFNHVMDLDESERLRQAAPALLAACKAVVDSWESGDLAAAARQCEAAVAEAQGARP